jgi:ABC-type lipoprotein export system ATPase subunit/predicted  nucleic acid-binding Zn-ribbon protein
VTKRLSHEQNGFHRIEQLAIVGGFMDGTRAEFDPRLNCLIGARGTGKTTALELIRFALDAMPEEAAARKRIESLIERNLGFGRVELRIETKDGLAYVVSRAVGEDPVVMTADGKPTDITLKAGTFFKADVFSQNEVEGIADRSLSQLDLIDNFEAERIGEINQQLKHLAVELSANASAMTPLQEKLAALADEIATLPELVEKLKGLSATAGDDADAINRAHALKSLRDRELRAVDGIMIFLEELSENLGQFTGKTTQQADLLFTPEMLEGPNHDILAQSLADVRACAQDVDAHVAAARKRIEQQIQAMREAASKLSHAHKEQEMAFRALIEKHQAAMGQATERSRLEKLRNDLLAKKRLRDETSEKLAQLQTARAELLQRLSELRDKRFQVRKAVTERINKELMPTIRVSIVQDGNPERYRQLVEEGLRGTRLKYNVAAQKIVNALWPTDLATIIKTRDVSTLMNKAELSSEQAEKVLAALSASERLFELETVELLDQPKIELNDGGTYKDSPLLSTGQKCTTILPILLMKSERPLLVDQPEDNLDNRFISQTVVDSVRRVKTQRQLIFVTHNPNIPVLGDAERVFVLESNGTAARIARYGTVDECKTDVVTLLEGGEEAFRQRKERYKY